MAAVTMLRRDGHFADAVATMPEATRMLANSPYDVVFMDGDLSDATVETAIDAIRGTSALARMTPIVVLAPWQDETETRAWRDAGAADIMTANPTLQDLVDAIGRNVWQSHSFGPGLGFMPGLEVETEEGIPILSAERIAELQTNIPPEDLLDMVEECISDLFHRLPALRRSLAVGAPGAITAHAHAMVGMAGGYGMAVLEARLRAILTAARGRRLDTIDGAAEVVEADLTRAAASLRRALRLGQPAPTGART
jgi:CheY-like chemotaxis protein